MMHYCKVLSYPASNVLTVAPSIRKNDVALTQEIIQLCKQHNNFDFIALSQLETVRTKQRDEADGRDIVAGISFSMANGSLLRAADRREVTVVKTDTMTIDETTAYIKTRLPQQGSTLITIQGLSGVGKGSAAKVLAGSITNGVCYSNGDIFRSLTYMAYKDLEQQGIEPVPDNIRHYLENNDVRQRLINRLHYEFRNGALDFSFSIPDGLLRKTIHLSEIKNGVLKEPYISLLVPVIASRFQGEVIGYATNIIDDMLGQGYNVVLEGREVTLKYFHTPYRFELSLNDENIIGERRAAQRILDKIREHNGKSYQDITIRDIEHAASELN